MFNLYTRYHIVARALGLAAFRPSASREQRYLAYKCLIRFIILLTSSEQILVVSKYYQRILIKFNVLSYLTF